MQTKRLSYMIKIRVSVMPSLSVVMPAYNEEMTIADAVASVVENVAPVAGEIEFIVVDDGSKDRTSEIVTELQTQYPFLKLVTQVNAGHGAALRRGIDQATGEWLLLLDSDCQIGLRAFADHWARRTDYDALLGVRHPRHDPQFRLVISLLMKYALRYFAGVSPEDAGAPYKIVAQRTWHQARDLIQPGSWIPSVLLAAYVLKNDGLRVVQTEVQHFKRPHGESTLNARRLTRFCWHALGEIREFGKAIRSGASSSYATHSVD